MKYIKLAFLMLLGYCCLAEQPKKIPKIESRKVIVEIRFSQEYINSFSRKHVNEINGDSITFRTMPVKRVGLKSEWTEHKVKVANYMVKLAFNSSTPVTVEAPFWNNGTPKILNPGDSINVTYADKGKACTGNGSVAFNLEDKIDYEFANDHKKWKRSWIDIESLNDYMEWNAICDNRLKKFISLIDSAKSKIPFSSYDYLKKTYIYFVEHVRAESFMLMMGVTRMNGTLKSADWVAICDSTLNDPWAKWLRANSEGFPYTWYFYQYNRFQVWKKYGFDLTDEHLNSEAKRRLLYYNSIKSNYGGMLRERLLQYELADQVMRELGYKHPLTVVLLKDYYKQSGFPEYKQWMKEYEKKAAVLYNSNADEGKKSTAPYFHLTDIRGKDFTNDDLKGKVALFDFWFSGCTGCVQMAPALKKVEAAFAGDSIITFVSVSTDADKNRWLKSIEQKKYTTGSGLNVYTDGKGASHSMIQDYNISGYPDLCLIDTWGQIYFHIPDPRKDDGAALISLLRKMRATLNDGPYVLYKGDTIQIKSINSGKVDSILHKKNEAAAIELNVMTDEFPRSFKVALKHSLQTEPSVFNQPEKQLVLSDIEGNFDVFRKLLLNNGVIDNQFNWTFGNGHLILDGDMVDRGEQVIECLWLIYALEEKAKQAGGYVHFILGNHEILNMTGDLRYVQDKYKRNVVLLHEDYKSLFGENSELGRWLRTKNIIEKIGDILYTHGGIASDVNNLPLSLQQMNDLIRPHYAARDEFKQNNKTPELKVLFNSKVSPFWYRGYYSEQNQATTTIDSTLQKFGVNHIVTGHTIVSDTISVHYDGRIINTDVHHAEGKCEALLVEGNKYFRVNINGKRQPLDFTLKTDSNAALKAASAKSKSR